MICFEAVVTPDMPTWAQAAFWALTELSRGRGHPDVCLFENGL